MPMKTFYVYIMGSETGTLYVGMTSDIRRRVHEHKSRLIPGFTDRYDVDRLLYFEVTGDAASAISKEKKSRRGGAKRRLHLLIQ